MINNLEGKSAKELREIVLIQIEEYQKLEAQNVELVSIIEQAIKSGDWKVDGACDPDMILRKAKGESK